MFAPRHFAPRYFPRRYFPTGGTASGYTLAGAVGSAILSALSAALLWFRRLLGLAGTVEVTGGTATFSRTRAIVAEPATVTIAGQVATLEYSGDPSGSVNARRARFMLMGITRLWWLLLWTPRL
jgi:hypothetical protein